MSGGRLYANTNIIMQGDTYLLTRKRLREMVASEKREDLLKILEECGYNTAFDSDEAILEAERQQTLATFTELCDDPALTACVTALHQVTESNFAETLGTIARELKKIRSQTLQDYFTTYLDLTNARLYHKGCREFVPGGKLSGKDLDLFPEWTNDQIEAEIDRRLTAIANTDKDDIFQLNPLFWWYCQKQKEFQAVRIVLMGKRFNYDATRIRTALKELYEQFE